MQTDMKKEPVYLLNGVQTANEFLARNYGTATIQDKNNFTLKIMWRGSDGK